VPRKVPGTELTSVADLSSILLQGVFAMKMGKIEKLFVNNEIHSRQVSEHFERLLQHTKVERGQTYLDLGCGNGAAPIHLAQTYGLVVTGIDVDPEQIALAQTQSANLPNVRFLTIDGTQLPFADVEFDIVATNKVMHHIGNWLDAVAEMIRVLKPGGYLIFADIVVPPWLARAGQYLLKDRLSFPTVATVDELLARENLSYKYRRQSLAHYELVCYKH
jgi:ubiquinone/menaquinone biosynthesis C-methylase UbiE